MQDSVNIVETVLEDAYNDFDHFKDTNYHYEDREAVRALKLIGIKIYE